MNKNKFNSSIYVVGWGKDYPLKPAKPDDGKGIHALNWRTTDIKAGEYNGNTHLIFTEYSDAQKYFRFPECAIFQITSLIHSQYRVIFNAEEQSRKQEYLTTNLCVIDIDDLALKNKPENKLYDADFDNSKERYSLSNKILNIIESENGGGGCTEITISNKGYHIITEITPEVLPLLGCQHLRLTDYICEKYVPEYMLEDVEEISFKNFSLNNARDTEVHNYSYIDNPNYRRDRKFRSGAFIRYLNSIGIQPKGHGKKIMIPCVFHGETEASLSIDTDQNLYHCFGCGASGNLFQFVERYQGLSNDKKRIFEILEGLNCYQD